jgi:hypothetical protein
MGFFSQHDVGKKSHVNMEHLFLMFDEQTCVGVLPVLQAHCAPATDLQEKATIAPDTQTHAPSRPRSVF